METEALPKKIYVVLALPLIIFVIALVFQWNRINDLSQTVEIVSGQSGLTGTETQSLFASGQVPYLKSVNGQVQAINKNQLTVKVTVPDFNASWPDKNNPPMIEKTYSVIINKDTKISKANPQDINQLIPVSSDQIKIGSSIQIQSEENVWNKTEISAKEIIIFN